MRHTSSTRIIWDILTESTPHLTIKSYHTSLNGPRKDRLLPVTQLLEAQKAGEGVPVLYCHIFSAPKVIKQYKAM